MWTLLLGFDAFDPTVFERLSEKGKLPHLTRYVEIGGYARLAVANPPQTEVSWTSIATGSNPGGHGIFDFVHRDPATYTPYLSLLPTKTSPFGTRFVPPYKARTIFEETTRQGFPATVLWWPATFPARPELPVRALPGLGTPDVKGRWGVGTLFASDAGPDRLRNVAVVALARRGTDRYAGSLAGPSRKSRGSTNQSALDVQIDLIDDGSAHVAMGDQTVELIKGRWSPVLVMRFKVGRLVRIHALARLILTHTRPHVRLYVSPLQIVPMRSPWRYATPRAFVKQVWSSHGPFLTLGWPQDTTALEEGCIADSQFLDLCESVFTIRERILLSQLEQFNEGILASIFDSLDRVQHMFRRSRPGIVDDWYVRLDGLVGKVEQRLMGLGQERPKVVIVSDHGFSDFDYKVHVNRWLIERGYLVTRNQERSGSLQDVDWSQSQAYAVGLNSIYLNLAGREAQGSVVESRREAVVGELCQDLLEWKGLSGCSVVQRAQRREEAFVGPYAQYGPDIVVGFAPGYRASSETGLGKWKHASVEPNFDHWAADHCVDSQAVPGVLFSNQDLRGLASASYQDIPMLTIEATLGPSGSTPPPTFDQEDQEILEERLKGLGYL